MKIEQVERALFNGREIGTRRLYTGNSVGTGLVCLIPLVKGFAEVKSDSEVEMVSYSHGGDIKSHDGILVGNEINEKIIKTKRIRLFTRKPIIRYTP